MSDARNYAASRLDDGSWLVCVPSSSHGFRTSGCRLIAWTVSEDGTRKLLGNARAELHYKVGELTAQPEDELAARVVVRLADAELPSDCLVWFRAASKLEPDNVRAYFAYRRPDGSFVGTVVSARHGMAGGYQVTACAGSIPIVSTEFQVAGCT